MAKKESHGSFFLIDKLIAYKSRYNKRIKES